ncbi:acyl-CoA N-acyltransferase [Trichoderma longibrachiatum ATCC 18648]|uniref:Acyl-CoA N-acyltransferase n=1 Tax=Trichoderma longibrachiatum ATCC 18648 TaxID=983965 RepID=A0A2T4BTB9_TRILO|nr:acyl-CoA N-acyltransferase [Trichoderma longibrachiatum ATCC 18648]
MPFTVSKVQVSDAESIARHVHTMFPQAATMTEAQKNEVIAWYSDMQRDAFEEGSESFLKVSSADGSPVGFCGWTVIGQKGEAIGGAKHERRKATWMPETLDQDSWIKLSHAPRAERNRVLKDFDDITRLTFMAVSPEHQRQGIGSMMMQRVCEETDRHGRCAYVLAAPEGVRLYTKFGFETIGCVETAQGTDYEWQLFKSWSEPAALDPGIYRFFFDSSI